MLNVYGGVKETSGGTEVKVKARLYRGRTRRMECNRGTACHRFLSRHIQARTHETLTQLQQSVWTGRAI